MEFSPVKLSEVVRFDTNSEQWAELFFDQYQIIMARGCQMHGGCFRLEFCGFVIENVRLDDEIGRLSACLFLKYTVIKFYTYDAK